MNCMLAVIGLLGLVGALSGLIGLALFVFWVWMLVDVLTNKGLHGTEKIVWVLVVILLPFLGSVIYFFVGRNKAGG